MHDYSVYVCVYSYVCMYVGVLVGVCMCGLVWVLVWVYDECVLIPLPLCMFGYVLHRVEFVRWDPTRCRRSRPNSNLCRYGPDTQVIRRPIHGMIRRSVPVRAVKPRQRFGSKPRYFMWIFVLMYFLIYHCQHAFTCYCYHFMWLSVIFYQFDHEISMNVHFNYVVDMSLSLRYFMC